MKIPPRPPSATQGDRRKSPLRSISTGVHVDVQPRKPAKPPAVDLESRGKTLSTNESEHLLEEMRAAAQSGLDGELSPVRVVRLVEEEIAKSPELAVASQSRSLTPPKLKLVD